MRLATFLLDGRRRAGIVDGETLAPLDGVSELGPATPIAELRRAPASAGRAVPLDPAALLPVVPRPGKIICVGRNYHEHVEEGADEPETPEAPVLFAKFRETLIGPYAPIVKPPESDQVDYEAELAVVIGASVRRVSTESAVEAVAGYTVANDVTMRDYQLSGSQWLPGKAWAGSTPLGPFLVTPDEIDGSLDLEIRLERNGTELQAASTGQLIFDVATLISYISRFTPLEPGDLILTGTPGGVGYHRDPPVFLTAGDRVRVEIERIGAIENQVEDERV